MRIILRFLLISVNFYGIAIFIVASIAFTFLLLSVKKQCPKFLLERSYMSPDILFDTFYSDSILSKNDVIRLIKYVEWFLDLPTGKLRPNDKFKDLVIREEQIWRDDLFHFFSDIEIRCEIAGLDKALIRMKLSENEKLTVGNYIEFLAPLESKIGLSKIEKEFM